MNQGNNPASFDERQLSRLGLLHPPFANEGFQFEDADIESARNLAVHLLQSSNRLIILSGPPGVGRTTFLRQIAAMHTDELDCCTLVGSPQLRVANIAKMLAMRLGVSEIASDPTTLAARLRQAQASGYRPALLIDDAQRLEENTVKGLLLLREAIAKAGGRLPILLTAPTGTERELLRLTASVADQNELSEIILPAFTEAQTASYLDQSLAAAGEHTSELLSARQKQQIHQQAQGIPAAINRETTRILTEATLKRGPVPTPTPRASSPARRAP
ncbi:MAG TPA: AAA family ATPase, partial [Nitrococcus sp.]|nr:AAA family ATPase [Nitrococcus sp.]